MEAKGKPARRERAWWQWVIGGGLLGGAAILAVLNYWPALAGPKGLRPVEPKPIRISKDLEPAQRVPAEPGELAGSNVLLVTYDTTRADHLGCYGHERGDTPAADQLAREGVLFSQAVTTAPTTLPSHSSMMTGLYPFHHGARANNTFRLDDSNVTLAEVLAGRGYATAAFVSAFVLNREFGIDQGFADFDDDVGEKQEKADPLEIAQRSADVTNAAAEQWLRDRAGENFFLWVHYYDPHFPYEAPPEFTKRYKHPYDAEIAFADYHVGRLLGILDEKQLTDDTLIVLVGDHGEGLGQHQELFHATLIYDSVMHVPFVMRHGRMLGGGVHVDRPVSVVDIMPTVLSLLGVDYDGKFDGHDLTQPIPEDRPIYMETLQGLADYGWAALLGVRQGGAKYVYSPDPELYNVAGDPFELDEISDDNPLLASSLHARLESFFGSDLEQAASAEPTHQLSAEARAKLESLGYMAGGADMSASGPRPHPRDMTPLLARANRAHLIERRKGLDAAIAHLERLCEEHPAFTAAHQSLASAYLRKDDLEAAEDEFAICRELRPTDTGPLISLAEVKLRQRKPDDAIALYGAALELDENNFIALNALGRLYYQRGDFNEAADVLKRALATRPRDPAIPDKLAEAMGRVNRDAEAIELFEGYLEKDPDLPRVRNALAGLYAGPLRREFGRAVEVLREGVRISPDKHDLKNNLAFILATTPDEDVRSPSEAAVMMEQVCEATGYRDPRYMHTLSLVYAAMMRMDEAISMAERARRIASESGDPALAGLVQAIGGTIQHYRALKEQGVDPSNILDGPQEQPTAGLGSGEQG